MKTSIFIFIKEFIKDRKTLFLSTLIIWIFIQTVPIFTPLLLKKYLDSIQLQNKWEPTLLYIFLLLILVRILLVLIGNILDVICRQYISKKTSLKLFENSINYNSFDGHILKNYKDNIYQIENYFSTGMDIIGKTIYVVFSLGILFYINIYFGITTSFMLLVIIIMYHKLKGILIDINGDIQKRSKDSFQILKNISDSAPFLTYIYPKVKSFLNWYFEVNENWRNIEVKNEKIRYILSRLNYVSGQVIIALAFFFIFLLGSNNYISIGDLIVILTYSLAISGNSIDIYDYYIKTIQLKIVLKEMNDFHRPNSLENSNIDTSNIGTLNKKIPLNNPSISIILVQKNENADQLIKEYSEKLKKGLAINYILSNNDVIIEKIHYGAFNELLDGIDLDKENYSGGEKTRILIRQALLNEPDIIIINDLLDTLDFENQQILLNCLEESKSSVFIVVKEIDEKMNAYPIIEL